MKNVTDKQKKKLTQNNVTKKTEKVNRFQKKNGGEALSLF